MKDSLMPFTEKRFCAGISFSGTESRPVLTVRLFPVYSEKWIWLREHDRTGYCTEKKTLEILKNAVAKYIYKKFPEFVLFHDVCTPATYKRYSGNETGAIYNMPPYIENFGRKRIKTQTPLRGFEICGFMHGVMCSMLGGIQASDVLAGGNILGGRCIPRGVIS
ncbi:MAG: hypothetical protein ACLFQK_01745 [Fibrobacterota bacterium]